MPGKKAHKPRDPEKGGAGIHQKPGHARKSTGQTEGQYSRDQAGRKGQFTGAGDSPITKK